MLNQEAGTSPAPKYTKFMAGRNKTKKVNEEAARLCKELGCSKLYINTKGEYFTEYAYAVSSEGGNKKNVSVYEAAADAVENEQSPSPEADEVENPEKTDGNGQG